MSDGPARFARIVGACVLGGVTWGCLASAALCYREAERSDGFVAWSGAATFSAALAVGFVRRRGPFQHLPRTMRSCMALTALAGAAAMLAQVAAAAWQSGQPDFIVAIFALAASLLGAGVGAFGGLAFFGIDHDVPARIHRHAVMRVSLLCVLASGLTAYPLRWTTLFAMPVLGVALGAASLLATYRVSPGSNGDLSETRREGGVAAHGVMRIFGVVVTAAAVTACVAAFAVGPVGTPLQVQRQFSGQGGYSYLGDGPGHVRVWRVVDRSPNSGDDVPHSVTLELPR